MSTQYQQWTDRQTDGQNSYNNIVLCMHRMLTHNKNFIYTKK